MRVAARDGLEGISLRHVGAEAGVTSGMVQHYFPSKDALMHYAMDLASQHFAGTDTKERVEGQDQVPVRDQILALMTALLPMDQERRDAGLAALAFAAYAATNQTAAAKLAHGTGLLREHLAGLLRSAEHDGLLAEGVEPDKAAVSILGVTDGLGLHSLTAGLNPNTATEALEHHITVLFNTAAHHTNR